MLSLTLYPLSFILRCSPFVSPCLFSVAVNSLLFLLFKLDTSTSKVIFTKSPLPSSSPFARQRSIFAACIVGMCHSRASSFFVVIVCPCLESITLPMMLCVVFVMLIVWVPVLYVKSSAIMLCVSKLAPYLNVLFNVILALDWYCTKPPYFAKFPVSSAILISQSGSMSGVGLTFINGASTLPSEFVPLIVNALISNLTLEFGK